MYDAKAYQDTLRRVWGYPHFRGIQADIIRSIAEGHDTLGLMPTGGGKSITFQVPAILMEGTCLVITPLIALMKDQVANLRKRGIMAAAIYSGMTHKDIIRHLDNAHYGAYKLLYVSPERLVTPLFQSRLRSIKVSMLVVDEAHCISQWGYDFRPHYLRIAEIRALLPGVPVLALTATATTAVCKDIQQKLAFKEGKLFRMSFERKNLRYVVRRTDDKIAEIIHILRSVGGSAIVYTRNRNATAELVKELQAKGITAMHYHARITSAEKDARQELWQNDLTRVMVATNAFGMGIDKPDVRLVIHYNVPDSLEAYFQEAGRAGRDGGLSYAVLLCNDHDVALLRRRVGENYPPRDYVRQVYEDVACYLQVAEGEGEDRTFEFNLEGFSKTFHHFPTLVQSALHLLERAGYICYSDEDEAQSRLMFIVRRDDLYHIDYLNSDEERVLQAVLRCCTGVFADYMPINETIICEASGLDPHRVYETLKSLTRHRLLNYVPAKRVPRITYLCRRLKTEYIDLPTEVYDLRKKQFEQRVNAMIGYLKETELCRSRYLLRYFDDDADNCGGCDICLNKPADTRPPVKPADTDAEISTYILAMLEKGKPLAPQDIDISQWDEARVGHVLRALLDEGKICCRDGMYHAGLAQ